MQIWPPVLMPIWMVIVMIIGILLVSAWLLRTFLVTRRDTSREVGDIPMAPRERRQWGDRLTEIGGTLRVDSATGKGCTVTAVVPS